MHQLATDGYQICRGIFEDREIEQFRIEADRLAVSESSACVRHIREKSGLFNLLATSDKVSGLIAEGLGPVRSILFDKTPRENWPVPWHQDLTLAVGDRTDAPGYGPWSVKDGVVHVQPPVELLQRMTTVRIHLDPTPAENGALRVLPGSHRLGKIPSDEVAVQVDDSAITCECEPGDVLLMSPLILHSSRKSAIPARRRVVHFEYAFLADLGAGLEWHE